MRRLQPLPVWRSPSTSKFYNLERSPESSHLHTFNADAPEAREINGLHRDPFRVELQEVDSSIKRYFCGSAQPRGLPYHNAGAWFR